MNKIEYIGFLASIAELTAIYLLGKRSCIGFVSNIIGGLLWITYALISQSAFGLIFVCSAALFLNVKGYLNWKGGVNAPKC